ncbi:hypothetical protein ACQKWADRAFT_237776 [Trichoderma austrokoningii]
MPPIDSTRTIIETHIRKIQGLESRREQVVDQFSWLPFRKFASDKLISLPSQLGNGQSCQKSILCPKVRAIETPVKTPKGPAIKWSLFRSICRENFFSLHCFGPCRRCCKNLHLQQKFASAAVGQCPQSGTLNDAHRRLSSVLFVTGCPCGCSRLVAQGSEASKALLAGGALRLSAESAMCHRDSSPLWQRQMATHW